MRSADCPSSAEAFYAALESGDFPSAGAALARYLEPIRSGGCLTEIADARTLIDAGLRAAVERRAVLARDLFRLRQLQAGYRLRPAANTWEISG